MGVRKDFLHEIFFGYYSEDVAALMSGAFKVGSELVEVVREEVFRHSEIADDDAMAVHGHPD